MTAFLKHTPTPWYRNIPPVCKYPVIFSGRNVHVLVLATRGLSETEIEANCDFVLSAVNAHDELVAALGALRKAVIASGNMNTREYVDLGIQVTNALTKVGAL